ncbi:Helix-turn-helix domain-containing protein [Aliiroseovarius crassostreae]|uniref:HTH araC/xylS-type domain-containing protein n=1 Tax=Aliiroseovarius crassostreae TaxID=154981 RepID=A0A0P7IYN6_9RHOB|nr:helix-turn-helix domain-containing protein [Aliiroseovarius crassostreae]KPN63874.1 hypothetical protein AKJ29_14390 [Aliiroseovarius crassostreae]SFU82915.1 Helix-turn-helix domain-containing protein [Aliiroseovarius crassostreae]
MKHDLAELKPAQKVTTIGFLCLEGFPLEQLSVALNYLKSANQFEAGLLFQTRVVSFMGGEVESCCGLRMQTRMIESEPRPFQFLLSDLVRQSSGQAVRAELDRRFLHFQRGTARRGVSRIAPAFRCSALTGDGVVGKAIELIRQNLERPVLLTQIACDVGISLRQLERKFLGVTGLSPKAYYMAERLERTDMLIKGTSLTMPEIALTCGFGSYLSFSQRYRKNFGDTPMRRLAPM